MQLFPLLFIIWTHKPLLVCVGTCQIQAQPCVMPCWAGSHCRLPAAAEQAQSAASPRCHLPLAQHFLGGNWPSSALGSRTVPTARTHTALKFRSQTNAPSNRETKLHEQRPSRPALCYAFVTAVSLLPSLFLFRHFQEYFFFNTQFRLGFGKSVLTPCSDTTHLTPAPIILRSCENPGSYRSCWGCNPAWPQICSQWSQWHF